MIPRPAFTSVYRLGLIAGTLSLGLLSGCGTGSSTPADGGVVRITEPDKLTGGAGVAAAAPAASNDGAMAAEPAASPAAAEATTAAAPSGEAAGATEGWGTLKGRVVFVGDVPLLQPLVAKGSDVKDAQVCAAQDVPNEKLIVDPTTKGVRNAIVYIPRPTTVNPAAQAAAEKAVVEFDQKNCVFVPHVLAVAKGGKILIKSSDQAGHNVHSLLRGTSFNQGIQPGSQVTLEVKNAEGRPGQVVCDIHPWMKAWWLTLNNPYFAVTNEQGEFEIKDVPAGEQKVVVWTEATHPAFVTSSGTGDPVTIPAGGEASVEFKLEASKVK
jgi:plastocyanin